MSTTASRICKHQPLTAGFALALLLPLAACDTTPSGLRARGTVEVSNHGGWAFAQTTWLDDPSTFQGSCNLERAAQGYDARILIEHAGGEAGLRSLSVTPEDGVYLETTDSEGVVHQLAGQCEAIAADVDFNRRSVKLQGLCDLGNNAILEIDLRLADCDD